MTGRIVYYCRIAYQDGPTIRYCELEPYHDGKHQCTVHWATEPSRCVITWG
jgi:hypothetical protein